MNGPNGRIEAMVANSAVLNVHVLLKKNVATKSMYDTNKMPCAMPTIVTILGMSAKYFNGIAINSNNKNEIPSI